MKRVNSFPTKYGFSVPEERAEDEEFIKARAKSLLSNYLISALRLMTRGIVPGCKYTQLEALRNAIDVELAVRLTDMRSKTLYDDNLPATVLMSVKHWEVVLTTLDRLEDGELSASIENAYNTIAAAVDMSKGIGRYNKTAEEEQ